MKFNKPLPSSLRPPVWINDGFRKSGFASTDMETKINFSFVLNPFFPAY